MCDREHAIFTPPHNERRATIARGPRDDRAAHGLATEMRPRETQHVHGADHEARIEGLLAREVPHASGTRACAEAREIQRDHAPPTRRERAYDRAPVLGPSADAVNEKDRIAGRTVSALFKYTSTQALDRDRARLHLWVSCSDALLLPLHRRREAAQRSVSPGCAIQGRRCLQMGRSSLRLARGLPAGA